MNTERENLEEKKIIGKMICEKRREKGLTQSQTSKITGLSRSYIADIENDRYTPSVKALTKLAKCLDIDLNFLIPMT